MGTQNLSAKFICYFLFLQEQIKDIIIFVAVQPLLPLIKLFAFFYLFLQKQKRGSDLHIYLEEGPYHKRMFRGPNTNDMKK